jgi:NDP-sugar pyrophosphorylase family protein
MKKSIQLLIPMSGQGTRYQKAGYTEPKPLIAINGTAMIERLLSCLPERWPASFIMANNHKDTQLPSLLKKLRPAGNQFFIEPHSQGPSFAVLKIIDQLPASEPVLLSYCDYGMVWDAQRFEDFVLSSDCDACLISYRGFHAHYLGETKYAYSRLEQGSVKEVKEKGAFTDNRENEFASCGAYYFKSAKLLKEAIEFQLQNEIKLNGEYYTSLTVEALLRMSPSADVRVFEIQNFFQWGTPEDLRNFEYWEKSYHAFNKSMARRLETDQVLLPMAGFGSRFASITKIKKPLIKLAGEPMFKRALATLPLAQKTVVISVAEVINDIAAIELNADTKLVALDHVPAGQALTVEMGLSHLDLDRSVFISACDHGLVVDSKLWEQVKITNADAVVFTVVGFPGVSRTPGAYSYVKTSETSLEPLKPIEGISLKKPITGVPANDHLLVGSFWFRSGHILAQGIKALKASDKLVNNELYLDGIFDELNKLSFKCVALPLDAYFNWGDPNSLKEALYWQEVFMGQCLTPRSAFTGVEL